MEEHSAPPIDPHFIYSVKIHGLDENTFTNMFYALRFAVQMDACGYVVESVTRCPKSED